MALLITGVTVGVVVGVTLGGAVVVYVVDVAVMTILGTVVVYFGVVLLGTLGALVHVMDFDGGVGVVGSVRPALLMAVGMLDLRVVTFVAGVVGVTFLTLLDVLLGVLVGAGENTNFNADDFVSVVLDVLH